MQKSDTTSSLSPLGRPALEDIIVYKPGKPIEEVKRELGLTEVVKLASNENALGPSPRAVEAMKRAAEGVRFYPEDTCHDLVLQLAEHLAVPKERLIIGHGSDEIIHMLGLAFLNPGDEVIYAVPPFPMYPITTTQMAGKQVPVPLSDFRTDLDAMAAAVTSRTKLVFIANPHNPTGTIVTKSEVDAFLAALPEGVIVVMDEAYFEYVYANDYPDSLAYIAEGRHVVVLRTFSKVYALAGLRVGYGVFPDHLVDTARRVRPPFNVNSIAQAAALAGLQDTAHIERSREHNRECREFLCREFDCLGLSYPESQANFIIVDLGIDCDQAFQALLRRGYIVRSGAGFGLPTHIRLSFGSAEENAGFIAALEEVLAELR